MLGFSGGGHAALLLAGRAEVWAGVSVWCGISDLKMAFPEPWLREAYRSRASGQSTDG